MTFQLLAAVHDIVPMMLATISDWFTGSLTTTVSALASATSAAILLDLHILRLRRPLSSDHLECAERAIRLGASVGGNEAPI